MGSGAGRGVSRYAAGRRVAAGLAVDPRSLARAVFGVMNEALGRYGIPRFVIDALLMMLIGSLTTLLLLGLLVVAETFQIAAAPPEEFQPPAFGLVTSAGAKVHKHRFSDYWRAICSFNDV